MSAPDSRSHVPGFRDGLGERRTIVQRSGAELEFLHFCEPLAAAPFFAEGLKTRVARLSRFTHASYCRVRRVQHAPDGDGSIALVSTHVAGRRLAEVLDVAERADLKPTTAAVLAAMRQIMTAAALLHDFAPDGFHGALGPGRVILPGDGRVVLAEHVLGTVVEGAAETWGVKRLWKEYRLATLSGVGSAHYGRRLDVVQIGLIALSLCLGRPLADEDYPDQIGWLLARATENKGGRTEAPLRPALRTWFERSLALEDTLSYKTLLESQRSLGQLAQEAEFGGSSADWDAFVRLCETAAVRVPLIVRIPEPAESPPSVSSARTISVVVDGASAPGVPAPPAIRADPFGPWPISVPADSAATLLDTFLSSSPAGVDAAEATFGALPPAERPAVAAGPWIPAKASPVPPEKLFEASKAEPVPAVPSRRDVRPVVANQADAVADWRTALPLGMPAPIDRQPAGRAAVEARSRLRRQDTSRRWARLVVIGLLAALVITGAVYSSQLWVLAYEALVTHGRVRVESHPPGAGVAVDGRLRGYTPMLLRLRPGEHEVEVQAGGSARSKKVNVQANAEVTEKFDLPHAGERGGLRITTHPAPGRIAIDGRYRGDAPLKITDLAPGTHTLVVETKLGTQEQDVVVRPGVVLPLAVPTASWVKPNAPFDLDVLEEGRVLGNTASGPVLVRPGRHTLEFANRELGFTLRQSIDAAPGQVVPVSLVLPTGMLNVYADQTAEVLVDGKKVGDTPLSSVPLPLGPHEVVLRHPTYGEVRYSVRVTLAAPVILSATFRK